MLAHKALTRFLPRHVRQYLSLLRALLFDVYAVKCYAQEGEDMILRRIYEHRPSGFFVDVGAHHPRRFSNTFLFYKRGWRGINIDAAHGSMSLFRRLRPRDVNVEAAVANDSTELSFHVFQEPALNSFDADLSRARSANHSMLDQRLIATTTLARLLAAHLPVGQKVDFMSVDVEGLELAVLRSNDWGACRPDYVLVEQMGRTVAALQREPLHQYMVTQGYELFAKTVNTSIYQIAGLEHDLA